MMGLLLICIFTFATSVGTLVIVYRMMDHIKILEKTLLQLLKPNYQDVEDILNKEKEEKQHGA